MTATTSPGGSSPLTRGKRDLQLRHEAVPGLIPAHTGKTDRRDRRPVGEGAHPRSRGENQEDRSCLLIVMGSSPLTRGKPSYAPWRPSAQRLIPAHAGKTFSGGAGSKGSGAHPRSRGENQEFNQAILDLGGSSPLTRGKLFRRGKRAGRRGLIPAHAGKTVSAC